MTRRSKREIESVLDDIDGPADVDEWLRSECRDGVECCSAASAQEHDAVVALATADYELLLPRDRIPDRIDEETDLPVKA